MLFPRNDPEHRLLADIDSAIHRLDADAPAALRGGLRFHVKGLEFPPQVSVGFDTRLISPGVAMKDAEIRTGNGHALDGRVELKGAQPAWIGVADGRYRLSIQFPGKSLYFSGKVEETTRRFYSLLEVDYSELPAEVEIRGTTIDLPPLRARLIEELKLLAPVDRAPFDLKEGFFRWTPVPGAAKYQLEVMSVANNEQGGRSHQSFGSYETKTTSVCLGVAPEQFQLLSNLDGILRPGGFGEWTVAAVDAKGRRVGAVVGQPWTFVIARGLERAK
jgi:hypothetical protein